MFHTLIMCVYQKFNHILNNFYTVANSMLLLCCTFPDYTGYNLIVTNYNLGDDSDNVG